MTHETRRDRARAADSPSRPPYLYLNEGAAASYLRSSRRTLKDLRARGGGPRYVRLGQAVRYRSDWLDAWAEAHAVSNTSEEAARRSGIATRGVRGTPRAASNGQGN